MCPVKSDRVTTLVPNEKTARFCSSMIKSAGILVKQIAVKFIPSREKLARVAEGKFEAIQVTGAERLGDLMREIDDFFWRFEPRPGRELRCLRGLGLLEGKRLLESFTISKVTGAGGFLF
jgi:hypothetical protein